MLVSVVIPCYNEETNIRNGVLHVITEYLDKQIYNKEVIIVDDGNEDASIELVERFIQSSGKSYLRLMKNQHGGKAATVISGMLASKGDVILFTDMDQATPLEEIEKLLPYFDQGYDIVFGSRAGERKGAPFIRQAMSRGFMVLRSLVLGLNGISDTQCGFKAFRKEVAHTIFGMMKIHWQRQNVKGATVTAAFDVEVLFVAKKRGYQLKEVPVRWHYVGTKRVNAIRESWRGFKDIIKLRLNDLQGAYNE